METKEITINGKKYPVVFNLQTIIYYEKDAKKTFFGEDFKQTEDRIYLIAAAAKSADAKTSLTTDEIKGAQDLKAVREIMAAYDVVMAMAGVFFEIPEVDKKNNPEPPQEEQEGEEKPKN